MKLNRLCSAVLSAVLLITLCACNQNDPVGTNPFSSSRHSARPSSSDGPDGPQVTHGGGTSTVPTPSSYTEYDSDHRLNVEIPELVDGLEMPVIGATGYTSVELPLYASIPGRTTTPTPAPSSPSETEPGGESPVVTDPPEPGPAESDDPGFDPPPPVQETDPPAQTPEDPEPPTQDPEPPAQDPEPTPEQPLEPTPPEESDLAADAAPAAAKTLTQASVSPVSSYAGPVAVWEPGVAFVILEEEGNWWRVSRNGVTGWIEHRYCMINLPDVIPSMIYNDTNAYSSIFASCGWDIPGVTGEAFYHSLVYNVRLNRQEFVMPILYSAARNICTAQHRALAEGNCLVVYQTFRPYETQIAVANAMKKLAKNVPEVNEGINTSPWSIDWFIATGVNNHQRGYALDVSMVKVYKAETRYIGVYPYLHSTDYEDYQMPTLMHELSVAAVSTISPSSSQLSATMNEPAIALRGYFTASGLTPLASEWWHFNDNAAMRSASAKPSDGKYYISECLSRTPDLLPGMY